MAARILLAAALFHLVRTTGATLTSRRRRSWQVLTAMAVLLALDNAGIEAYFLALRNLEGVGRAAELRDLVYFSVYLFNGALLAVLPAAVAAVHSAGSRDRRMALAGIAAVVLVALIGATNGALESWEGLLGTTRILSLLAVVTHLSFWAAYLLGRLVEVDAYLAGFVGLFSLYGIVLPVQEVFFELVGMRSARAVWHLNLGMLVAFTLGQAVIVFSLAHALGTGRPLPTIRPTGWPGPNPLR